MNRLYRGTLDLAAGCVTALMSRFDRARVTPAFESSRGTAAAPAPVAPERAFAGDPRILVVDDNPSNLSDACELLAGWGITPILAADGAEAVALACGGDFDLILMDLQMPVLDGLQATKQIRDYEYRQSCARAPVLAYTGCFLEADMLRDCGVDGVLVKPCSASSLEQCLLRWCAPRAVAGLETESLAAASASRR